MTATFVTGDNFSSKRGQRSGLYSEEVKAKTEKQKQKQERGLFCLTVMIMRMPTGFIVLSAKFKSTKDIAIRI
jgi:hypothetical protein